MINYDTADAIVAELPRLKALLAAEKAKGGESVPMLAHRLNALTKQLRAYKDALANPKPAPKVEPVPKRSLKGHARFPEDCTIENCSLCIGLGGRDKYSLPSRYFE